ncbi:hypothetical protein FTI75_03530, partial [Burkholderia pseudomallei]
TPDHGLALQTTRYLLFEPSKGIEPLQITTLQLPSHLAKSRHGVFYFRLTFRTAGATKEKRISLRTKNPQEARFKALCLSRDNGRSQTEAAEGHGLGLSQHGRRHCRPRPR